MQTSGANRHFEELRYDNPNISHSLCDRTPRWFSPTKPIFCRALLHSLSLCLCLDHSPSSPSLSLSLFPVCHTPFLCLCSRLSAAQSPTVTDPLQQAYAGVQHYAGDPSLLPPVLSHFLHLSLSLSPSLPLCLSHQWTLWQVEIAGPANFLPD